MMPSKYGFVTKDEDREIRRREEEERKERERLLRESRINIARECFDRNKSIITDILDDYANAREWTDYGITYQDFGVILSGNVLRGTSTTPTPRVIIVHVPLATGVLAPRLFLRKQNDWQAGLDDNLHDLAQIIADKSGVETCITYVLKSSDIRRPTSSDAWVREPGEHILSEYNPRTVS